MPLDFNRNPSVCCLFHSVPPDGCPQAGAELVDHQRPYLSPRTRLQWRGGSTRWNALFAVEARWEAQRSWAL